jgi:hypothetical protein
MIFAPGLRRHFLPMCLMMGLLIVDGLASAAFAVPAAQKASPKAVLTEESPEISPEKPAQEKQGGKTTAVVQVLDKVTARVKKLSATVNQPTRFGSLQITARDCRKNPAEDRPEAAAFLEIMEIKAGQEPVALFMGWMFASSPAVSAIEHAVYDVVVLDCQNPSGAVKTEPAEAPAQPADPATTSPPPDKP